MTYPELHIPFNNLKPKYINMEKPKNNMAVPVKQPAKTLKIPRTFEIMVEEMHEEDDGTVCWRPVMIDPRLGGNGAVTITVNSQQELQEK